MEKKYIFRNVYFLFAFYLVFCLFFLGLIRFTAWPEMLAWPYLILNGWLPYRDIAIAHNPLLSLDLSLFYKLFGVGVIQLKVFTWLLFSVASFVLFWVAKNLWSERTAFLAILFYFPLFIFYEGNGVWFDFYMGIFAFASFYFAKKRDFFWAGLFWGLAFLAKQTAFWFILPLVFSTLPLKEAPLKVGRVLLGAGLVLILFSFVLFYFGIFSDWWNWAFKFGVMTLPRLSGQIQLPTPRQFVISFLPFSIFVYLILNDKYRFINLFLWAIAGLMGVFPRFEFFHFQPALFYLSIALALVFSKKLPVKNYKFMLFYLSFLALVFGRFLFSSFKQETRFYEKSVQEVQNEVSKIVVPGEKIYIVSYWDSLYALTDTLPATKPLVPFIPWYLKLNGVEEKILKSLEEEKPKVIVASYPSIKTGLIYRSDLIEEFIYKNYYEEKRFGDVFVFVRK